MGTRDLTADGLTVKTQDEIRDDMATDLQSKSQWGVSAAVDPDSVTGQLIDAHAEEEVSLDELASEIMDQIDPDTATGVFLDGHANAAGITRESGETDAELRARRRRSLSAGGSSTLAAIRAALEDLADVTYAAVLENTTETTDSNGITPHGILAVLYPDSADSDGIAEALWLQAGGGIRLCGTQEADVTDDQGYTQTMRWEWAEEKAIHLEAVVTKGDDYPTSGDDDIKAALLVYGQAQGPGTNVKPDAFEAVAQLGGRSMGLDVDGVDGIEAIEVRAKIGEAPGAGDTGVIEIDVTEVATFNSTNIDVSSS